MYKLACINSALKSGNFLILGVIRGELKWYHLDIDECNPLLNLATIFSLCPCLSPNSPRLAPPLPPIRSPNHRLSCFLPKSRQVRVMWWWRLSWEGYWLTSLVELVWLVELVLNLNFAIRWIFSTCSSFCALHKRGYILIASAPIGALKGKFLVKDLWTPLPPSRVTSTSWECNWLELGKPTTSPLGVKNVKIMENSEKKQGTPGGPLGTRYNPS